MPAPDGYTTPTIPGIADLTNRKAWFETGDGKPVKPTDYDSMASDDPQKVKYDESVTVNDAYIAVLQARIDA
tara:strand:+ start:612 stop:827 length:216 start_codon:yes stop_codon:yes gene_type:complete